METQAHNGMGTAGAHAPERRIDRRRFLAAAGATTGAMWVAPTVLGFGDTVAAATPCSCGGSTTALQFLTAHADTNPSPSPQTCTLYTGADSGTKTFCRTLPTEPVYLWGSGTGSTGTNGPLFDDIGIVTVVEQATNITRYGNIYRFQNYCRQGGSNVPTASGSVGGYNPAVQRVYTIAGTNIWDYLPPQVSGSTQTTDPTTWWNNSQPTGSPPTSSNGNPGYDTQTPWPGPVDISLLFGGNCGTFTVSVVNRDRFLQYKWSNIFIGTTHP